MTEGEPWRCSVDGGKTYELAPGVWYCPNEDSHIGGRIIRDEAIAPRPKAAAVPRVASRRGRQGDARADGSAVAS